MSEYQYVAFRAIDRPVSGKNLEYMERQSSRAEITPWSFENEYHYGDFRGNAIEMLRRGYDIHLHYANFGIRKLLIRLPEGLPDPRMLEPYEVADSLMFVKDKRGAGGCLVVEPFYEPGDLEELWEVETYIDELVPLRAELLEGDLRPLYLAHLAAVRGYEHSREETFEAPIPAGLGTLTEAQRALAEFYDLSDALIAAAARESPPAVGRADAKAGYEPWVCDQPEAKKNAWLTALLADSSSSTAVRAKMLAAYRAEVNLPPWPTVPPKHTIAQLETLAAEIADKAEQRAAAKAAQQRAKRLAKMAADPTPTLRETEQLVEQRSTAAYAQVGELLADLREALAGSDQADLAEKQAQKLKAKNPTLHVLTKELRRRGFVPK